MELKKLFNLQKEKINNLSLLRYKLASDIHPDEQQLNDLYLAIKAAQKAITNVTKELRKNKYQNY